MKACDRKEILQFDNDMTKSEEESKNVTNGY